MNYNKIYNQIVERAKSRKLNGYMETHHIIPKCRRLLIRLEIPFIDYQNRRLYKFDDIINSVELMDILDIEKLGL